MKGRECHGNGSLPISYKSPSRSEAMGRAYFFCSYNNLLIRVTALTINSASMMQILSCATSQSKNWKAAALLRDVPRHGYFVSDKGDVCQRIPAKQHNSL